MPRKQITLFTTVAVLIAGAGWPQGRTTGTLFLSLRDSRNGAAIRPERVEIDGNDTTSHVDPTGLMSLRLSGGQHRVKVHARNYEPFEGTVTVEGEETPVNTFELDRITSSGLDAPPVDATMAVLAGYVVDSGRGTLIPEAKIEVPLRNVVTQTDEQGYFAMNIPVPSARSGGPSVAERVHLSVSKTEYVAEERRNIEIVSGTTMTVSVQLDRATSNSEAVKVIDEGRRSPRLHGWRFDVVIE